MCLQCQSPLHFLTSRIGIDAKRLCWWLTWVLCGNQERSESGSVCCGETAACTFCSAHQKRSRSTSCSRFPVHGACRARTVKPQVQSSLEALPFVRLQQVLCCVQDVGDAHVAQQVQGVSLHRA